MSKDNSPMFTQTDFGLLASRDDVADEVRRILTPLIPFFTPEGSGIRFGVLPGAQGEPTASLETLSRSLWGLVPLLAGGGKFAEADRWRQVLVAGTDPARSGYWGRVVSCDQRQVEQPGGGLVAWHERRRHRGQQLALVSRVGECIAAQTGREVVARSSRLRLGED